MSNKVDWNHACEAVGGAADLLVELIEIYFGEYPKLIEGIRTSLESCEWTDLRRFAHTLKGCLRYFGDTHAGKLALELEVMARDHQTDGASELFDRLLSETESMMPELQAFVDSQPPSAEA